MGGIAFERAVAELGAGAVTVADVGARWGAADSWFRLKPLARLVGFDPDPDECDRLNRLGDPAGERVYPVALGRENGPATLYVTREPGCSSVYRPSQAIIERYPGLATHIPVVREVPVTLTRLDDWAAAEGVARLDFMKLDTQGSELDILVGAGSLLEGCLGLEVEVSFSPLYDGQPLFADVDQFLRRAGFTLWRFDSLCHYTDRPGRPLAGQAVVYYDSVPAPHGVGDGRLVWCNATYFRDRTTLATRRDLLIQATLLEAANDLDGSRATLEQAG